MQADSHWMRIAIDACRRGIESGQSPFGAAIVRGDELVVAAHNAVWQTTDITAHAEVTAIRQACATLKTIDLSGCRIYSTTEPCPMCFAASHWARLDKIYYGASIADAQMSGFSELTISNDHMKRAGGCAIEIVPGVLRELNVAIFQEWQARPDRRSY